MINSIVLVATIISAMLSILAIFLNNRTNTRELKSNADLIAAHEECIKAKQTIINEHVGLIIAQEALLLERLRIIQALETANETNSKTEFLFKSFDDYRDCGGLVPNDAFEAGFNMARLTNNV